jgi:hypothetical protein
VLRGSSGSSLTVQLDVFGRDDVAGRDAGRVALPLDGGRGACKPPALALALAAGAAVSPLRETGRESLVPGRLAAGGPLRLPGRLPDLLAVGTLPPALLPPPTASSTLRPGSAFFGAAESTTV